MVPLRGYAPEGFTLSVSRRASQGFDHDAFRSKDQREDIPSRELPRERGKPPLLEKVDARE